MVKKSVAVWLSILAAATVVYAQGTLSDSPEDQIFWAQQVNPNQVWGQWLLEVFKPYSDKLGLAILKIATSAAAIDPAGKSSEELAAEVNATLNKSLLYMEQIKPPTELKGYHANVIEMYRHTINADPKEAAKNAVVIRQLTIEADRELQKVFQRHGVPDYVIKNFIKD